MPQKNVELILLKQISNYLEISCLILDPLGNLIFCNEAAEKLLNFRFSEQIDADEWKLRFTPRNRHNKPLEEVKNPFYTSNILRRMGHGIFYIKSGNNNLIHIEMITIPIINQFDIFNGVIAFFQDAEQ